MSKHQSKHQNKVTPRSDASPAGALAKYAKPKHKRTVEQSIGKYLGRLDSRTR